MGSASSVVSSRQQRSTSEGNHAADSRAEGQHARACKPKLQSIPSSSTLVPESDRELLAFESSIESRSSSQRDVADAPIAFERHVSGESRKTSATVASAHTAATSGKFFDEARQTLIFLDWDDTLFPTTYMGMKGWKPYLISAKPLPEEAMEELAEWRKAVHKYLTACCSVSLRCVIVTNSKRPWVTGCIELCAPELQPLFQTDGPISVVYAGEVALSPPGRRGARRSLTPSRDSLRPVCHSVEDDNWELRELLTKHKRAAMWKEATEFYSSYPGQTWKNIISVGDMPMEHDALQEVTFTRQGPAREHLRTKAIVVPEEPFLEQMILRLRFDAVVLPALVRFDGDIDLDTSISAEPLTAIANALSLPSLCRVPYPALAWSKSAPPPGVEEAAAALDALELVIEDHVFPKSCVR